MPARRSSAPTALAVLVLALVWATTALAAPKKARGGHPDAKGEPECASCHRTGTPLAFDDWERSKHGLSLVKCAACHGSTGADFRARPAASTCQGCHAAQVASLSKRAVKDCFACHAPHGLTPNPHR